MIRLAVPGDELAVAHALTQLASSGVTPARSTCSQATRARSFYERDGWHALGEPKREIVWGGEIELRYERALSAP